MSSVPDPSRDPYQAAITRAADLVGGLEALSHRLQVPMADIIRWLDGINRPPMGIFLKLVDVLNEETHRPRVAQQKR